MLKRKSIISMLLAGVLTLSLSACGGSAPAPAPAAPAAPAASAAPADGSKVGQTVFKLSFNQTIENPEAQTMLILSDMLYDATEGRYSIEVYPSEQLGPQKESLELVQAGAIEMAVVANSLVENMNSDFAIIGTPYIYDSVDHQKNLFQSGKLDELFRTTEGVGFNVLSAYSLGPRNVYTKSGPITSPADLAGKKIRTMQSDTMVQMMGYMGGIGTPMGQGDVYSAIQAGTLDGAENNIITYTDLLQYEVAPFYSETMHLMIPDLLLINSNALSKMSADDQAALHKVAKESIEIMYGLAAKLRDEYRVKCEEKGVTFTTVDIKPFQENMAPFIEEIANRSDMTKAVYESIKSLR